MKQYEFDFSKELSYRRALLLPFRIEPGYSALLLADNLVRLVLPPFGVLAAARFIDLSIAAISDGRGTFSEAIPWLLVLLAVRLYGYIEEPLLSVLRKKKEWKEWRAIDYPAVGARACLDVEHMENSDTADLVSRVSAPGASLLGMFWNLADFAVFAGQTVCYAAILIVSAPVAGLLILISAVPVVLIAQKSAQAEYRAKQDMAEMERLVWAYDGYLGGRDSACERAMFGYGEFLGGRFRQAFMTSRNYVLKTVIDWELRKKGSGIMTTVLCAVSLFLLLPSVASGRIGVGLYISLLSVIFTLAQRVASDLSSYFERLSADREYLNEYNQYVSLSRNPAAAEPMGETAPEFESLEFKNVTFAYPGTDVQVLKGVSFRIEAGKRYSLIGINGSGKSTIVKLILRMYDGFGGEILLNGRSVRDWDIRELKAEVSAVF